MNEQIKNLNKAIGESIGRARREKKMSLQQLLKESGLDLSKSSIVNIEKGRQQISVYQLWRLSVALNTTIDRLLKDFHRENSEQELKITVEKKLKSLTDTEIQLFKTVFNKY